jgi:thymidylate synthase (FAD)
MGNDLMVVNSARVSFMKFTHELRQKDIRLIQYLARWGHWTPFAHPQIQFLIEAPIFVARQLFRHNVGFVINEVSRRYVDDDVQMFSPDKWRKRAPNVKQGSSNEEVHISDRLLNGYYDGCLELYEQLLEKGVAPEQARMVLPQAMITKWIWTGSLLGFARVCKQRLDEHAQAETREVAKEISRVNLRLFPFSWKALMEHRLEEEDGMSKREEEVQD